MKFMKFDEYLNSKGKTEEKPVVSVNADRIDPETMPNAPPGGGNPYISKGEKNKKGTSKALGDMGEDITDMPKELAGKGKAAAKLPTVDEVALVNKVTKAAQSNPTMIETVVRSLKSQGLLGALVAETLNHRETYKHLSQVMAHESYGPDLCGKLVRAMNEEVAGPFADELDTDEEADDDDVDPSEEGEGEEGFESEEGFEDDEDVEGGMEGMGDEEGGEEEDVNAEMEPEMGDEQGPVAPPMDNPAMSNFHKAMQSYMRRMMGK
jgi:hypothetical protein